MTAFQMVMPLERFKWFRPQSFEPLRAQNVATPYEINTTAGPPTEATSPLDLKLLREYDRLDKILGSKTPSYHKTFAAQLRKRVADAGVDEHYYTRKVLLLALVLTHRTHCNRIFRDHNRRNPHTTTESDAAFKTMVSKLAEQGMFESLAGKTVHTTLRGGLR